MAPRYLLSHAHRAVDTGGRDAQCDKLAEDID